VDRLLGWITGREGPVGHRVLANCHPCAWDVFVNFPFRGTHVCTQAASQELRDFTHTAMRVSPVKG